MAIFDQYSLLLPEEQRYATAVSAQTIASVELQDGNPSAARKQRNLEGVARARKLARELLMVGEDNQDLVYHYLNVLIDEGLNTVKKKEDKKKVLIVGAGITGLVAASLLKKAGHEVTVIEANANRIGGRIKTFHKDAYVHGKRSSPFEDPAQYAEAGAMRLPSFHPLVLALIDKYGLSRRYFYNVSIEEGTGEPDRMPPVTYQSFEEGAKLWMNRDGKPGKPPQHTNSTWMRANDIQIRKSDYATPEQVAEFNTGFEMTGDRLTDTASQILKDALEPIRRRFEDCYEEDKWGNTFIKEGKLDDAIEAWASIIYEFDGYSMYSFLKKYAFQGAGLTDNEIEAVGTIENLTSRLALSFMHSFLGRTDINPIATYFEIEGGMWKLPEAIYQEVKDDVVLNRRMTHLEFYDPQRKETARFTSHERGKRVSIRCIDEGKSENGQVHFQDEVFTGDVCLVTIPFSSLRHVTVNPMFSYKKRRAIIELHYDAATKVLLEFSDRWWEFTSETQWTEKLEALKRRIGTDEYERRRQRWEPRASTPDRSVPSGFIGGGSVTDNPNRFLYYPSHPIAGSSGGVVLASYSWSDDARRWDSMEAEERCEFALSNLIKIHDWRAALFYTGHGATQSWMQSPYAFGEAAVFTPGQMTSFHLEIPEREGPVFFAGEHVSLKHAWIEGCLETATQAAEDIHHLKL